MTSPKIGFADQFQSGVIAYQNGLYQEAATIWTQIAQRTNDPAAQYNLGLLYEQGLGVQQNFAIAARHYLAAARQSYAPAQYNVAGLYYRGQGALQSNQDAVYWWSEAAQRGYARAQFVLGALLLQGNLVPRNAHEGMQWLRLAARQGDSQARELLARLNEATPDQVHIAAPDTTSSRSAALPSDVEWIRRRSPSNFTVQLFKTGSVQQAERFIVDNGIVDVATYYKSGNQYVVIGGAYEKEAYARTAIAGLTPALQRLQPIVTTFASVQTEMEPPHQPSQKPLHKTPQGEPHAEQHKNADQHEEWNEK